MRSVCTVCVPCARCVWCVCGVYGVWHGHDVRVVCSGCGVRVGVCSMSTDISHEAKVKSLHDFHFHEKTRPFPNLDMECQSGQATEINPLSYCESFGMKW